MPIAKAGEPCAYSRAIVDAPKIDPPPSSHCLTLSLSYVAKKGSFVSGCSYCESGKLLPLYRNQLLKSID